MEESLHQAAFDYKSERCLCIISTTKGNIDLLSNEKDLDIPKERAGLGNMADVIQKYFQFYPNPVANTLIISPKQNELEIFIVSIYNQLGIKIIEKKISTTNSKIQLSVGQLGAGIYHIVLLNAKEKYVSTFVKE
jgi:hypothetical protein